MKGEINANYLEWFKKADEDEFAGNAILKEKKFAAPACFHFQQMAEKYLKGLLIFNQKPFPKVHDLLELETLLLEFEVNIKELHEDLKILNSYYIETRYPGDYPEFTIQECEDAQRAAANVKEFVLHKIEAHTSNE
jgi:HEPN domain-containing protein